MHTSMHLRFIN